ncbi:phospholipase D/nuclease [Auricularia subglabra TFB-10046 SS5]|nr:phospholipase D/nuclease [Auricularia subglabra TFB-10046 SS5]
MDEDAQLAAAIAASLEDAKPKPETIVIDSDSEQGDPDAQFQRDMEAAIKASQESQGASSSSTQPAEPVASGAVTPAPAPASNFLAERRKMEAERLARQKRLRGDVNASANGSDEDMDDAPPPAKRQATAASRAIASSNRYASLSSVTNNGNGSSSADVNSASNLYWDGELRPTANMHWDADKQNGPAFRLSQIIGNKDELQLVVLSSYSNDIPWLLTMFPDTVPVILVNHPVTPDGNDLTYLSTNFVLVTPSMQQDSGAMHIKLMLLFYKSGRLRVAIPTANFIQYDWRDIENAVWLQDIPKRDAPTPFAKLPKELDFAAQLVDTLRALNVGRAVESQMQNGFAPPLRALDELRMWWDWSKVTARLVPSLKGSHEGWPRVTRVGHTSLLKALRDLGADTPGSCKLLLECQGSSIGQYTRRWTHQFYRSARGEPSEKFSWIAKQSAFDNLPYPPIKIIFPSLRTVEESVLGKPGGGTMFCDPKTWKAPKFPRENFFDSNSKRGRVLMHTKMILGIFERDTMFTAKGKRRDDPYDTDDDEVTIVEPKSTKKREKLAGWLYVGSHNFTPAAWGHLSGSSITPILSIRNYELGVVLPIKDPAQFDDLVCWKRPARKYESGKDVAWMQKEHLQ